MKPFSRRHALYLSIVPLACSLILKIYLQPMGLLLGGKGTKYQVLVLIIEFNSRSMTLSQLWFVIALV